MTSSVGSTIEKIKLVEQDTEHKLKERREYEDTVATLSRAIKETKQKTENTKIQNKHLQNKIDFLKAEVTLEKIRRDALIAQTLASKEELRTIKSKAENGIGEIWKIRSTLSCAVQKIADEYDVRALLIKPLNPEFVPTTSNKTVEQDPKLDTTNENLLKEAVERKNKALRERERLQREPDAAEEFVRIKNALQYSLEMVSKYNK